MKIAEGRAGIALLALMAAGCHAVPPPRSPFPTANDALARMKATYACVNGVHGAAKLDQFSPRGRVRGDIDLLAVNPDRVRIEVLSPFLATMYTLTSDGNRFQMLDQKEKQFLYGPASACNLARLTQVPVPPHALVALLRGEAPVLVHKPEDATIAWDGGGFYRIVLNSSREATQEIHLAIRPEDVDKPWSEQRTRTTDVRVAQRGVDLYQVDLHRFEVALTAKPRVDPDGLEPPVPPSGPACDAELPRSIRVRVPSTEQDVQFQYKEVAWNPPLIEGSFEQPIPGGVRKAFVTCGKGDDLRP